MLMLIENVEKPKLPKLVWALRKQFGPETLVLPESISLNETSSEAQVAQNLNDESNS